MTTFYLIRHGETDLVGHELCGRKPDVHLNDCGRRQADAIARAFAPIPLTAIFSSPQERARETADPLAKRLGLKTEVLAWLQEIDFGKWTGRRFDELQGDERWQAWNSHRSASRIPGGENFSEVRQRMVEGIRSLHARFPGRHLALVGHCDPLKAALMHFLGMPPDFWNRLELSPGGYSVLLLGEGEPRVIGLNLRCDALPTSLSQSSDNKASNLVLR